MPELHDYLQLIRTLPPKEMLRRGAKLLRTKATDKTREVSARLFGTSLSDAAFLDKAFARDFPFRGVEDLCRHFRNRTYPRIFCGGDEEKGGAAAALEAASKEEIIREADRVCGRIFDVLGSGDVHLGEKIDWHRDFRTGYRWDPDAYYRKIGIPYGKADIKVPWELSRFSHAVTLGQAYRLTGDEKYPREFIRQVNDWLDSNRPGFGVNWACTMDVAIRACNWIAGYHFFRDSSYLADSFLLRFLKGLYQHGRHIRENLEYSPTFTSNHYLSNISGLIYLGVVFPEFREAGEWRDFGIREIKNEMQKQVYPDGCDFEASTCYHRLVLELFFFPTLLVVINAPGFQGDNHDGICREIFGDEYTERLNKMFGAVLHLLKPNGLMPQIGDNDDGRLHIFAGGERLDMRYLLTFGAIFFQEDAFRVNAFGFCEEAYWILGEKGSGIWKGLGQQELRGIGSRAFPEAGWYVMRSNRDYLMVSCGPNGQGGRGGHAHNDRLSFELCLDGRDVFIDPGTYVYTPEPGMRNIFRSTLSHNTVWIEGMEQNRIPSGSNGLFRLEDDARARALLWESTDDNDTFAGEHYGFGTQGITHRREIIFRKEGGAVRITDLLQGPGAVRGAALFHLHPDVEAAVTGEGVTLSGKVRLRFTGAEGITLEDYDCSRRYGWKERAQVIRVTFDNELTAEIEKTDG